VFAAAAGMGPGIIQNYAAPGQLPLNSRSSTAKPGQVAILLGTGLGAIAGLDSQTPPVGDLPAAVQVTVGGKPATKLYSGRMPGVAGVDQINFQVPADAPSGCYVPVQVKAGGHYSNTVTMAIDARGQPCSDPQNPFAAMSAQGGKGGSVFLIRLNMQLQLEAGQPSIDVLMDLGLAAFEQNSPQGDLGFDPLFSLPPVGTCTAYGLTADISSILGGDLSGASGFQGFLGHDLDAGPSIAVSNSRNTVALEHMDTNSGPYFGLLGGTLPLGDGPSLPPFLNAGTVTITGAGGKDVGPFRASIDIGAPVVWSNRDQITQVDRAKDLVFTWSGGDDSKLILIGGAGSDMTTQATGLFFCFVPAGPGRFTVPASVLGNLPATGTNAFGALLLGSLPNGNYPKFTAAGLDWGSIFNAMLAAKTVAIQ
jgi:hypothetical protein